MRLFASLRAGVSADPSRCSGPGGPSNSREAGSPASLLLLGHAALAIALFATNGGESLLGTLFVLGMLALWIKALRGTVRAEAPGIDGAVGTAYVIALVSIVVSIALSFIRPPGLYLHSSVVPFLLLDGGAGALIATYWVDLQDRAISPRLRLARRASLFLLALAIGAWMLRASPDPLIDVFPIHQQAAQAILAGKSLYAPNTVHALDTWQHKEVVNTYLYFPLPACFDAVAYALTRDVRWAQLVAQLAGAALLWVIARRMTPPGASPRRAAWADVLTAILLFHPRGPFVLEEAWTEPIGVPLLGGFILLVMQKRPMLASVCFGLLCVTKQQLVFYIPFLAFAPGVGFVGLVVAGIVSVAVLLPFVLPSVEDFLHATFFNLVRYPIRADAPNVSSELARIGIFTPSWVGVIGWSIPAACLPRIPRAITPLLVASCVAFALFFLFGRQAFCNYYYMLDATALYALATLGGETTEPASVTR